MLTAISKRVSKVSDRMCIANEIKASSLMKIEKSREGLGHLIRVVDLVDGSLGFEYEGVGVDADGEKHEILKNPRVF